MLLFALVLRHFNRCLLINAKYCFYIYINYMMCKDFVNIQSKMIKQFYF